MSTRTDAPLDDFDYAAVPVYPAVPIELHRGADGTEQAFMHGREVPIEPGQTAKDAAFAAAAAEASAQHGDAVRVVATTSDGNTYRMVVHADGRAWDLPEPKAKKRPAWVMPTAAAGAVTVLALVTGGLALSGRNDTQAPALAVSSATPTPSGTPTELPVLAPDGWVTHALWSSPELAREDLVPLVYQGLVIVPTADSRLVAINASTGGLAWASTLSRSGLAAGPVVTQLGNGPSIVGQSGTDLLWWPLGGAKEPRTIALPQGATVTFNGAGPLVQLEGQKSAVLDSSGNIQRRVIPAGSVALAANQNGTVTTASDTGLWWHSTNATTAVDGAPLARPKAGAKPLKVAGYAGHHLVMLWTMPDKTIAGAIYDDAKAMALTKVVPLGARSDTPKWDASPTLTWGVLGNQLVHLNTGAIYGLGDWRTVRVINEIAYGQNGTARDGLAVDQAGHTRIIGARPTMPAAIAGGRALVIAQDGSDPRLYALPPRPTDLSPTSTTTPVP